MATKWDVEYTDELGAWWQNLNQAEQESIDVSVRLLEEKGPNLEFPHSSGIEGSRHSHMRELRVHPVADKLYDTHIDELKKEGLIHGSKIQ
jgi:hypothetical protein